MTECEHKFTREISAGHRIIRGEDMTKACEECGMSELYYGYATAARVATRIAPPEDPP